jgi:hypothetical protein
MATWSEFERSAPDMAAAGRKLIYQFGPGLGYLATVRKDGGPRVHPFCPVIHDGGLYGLIGPSPKRFDLLRDGRYALHTFPQADGDDEFFVTGTARRIDDPLRRADVLATYRATGSTSSGDEVFFGFDIERALLSIYGPRGDSGYGPPTYTKWRAH